MRSTQYLRTFAILAGLFVLGAGGLNAVVDPYGLYGWVELSGFNAKKAYAYNHTRLAKQARAERIRAKTVIIGNSRVDVGLDPSSSAWPQNDRPVINLGVPGDGVEGLAASFGYAAHSVRADTVFVGLDFTDFLVQSMGPMPDAEPGQRWRMVPQTTFSTSAVLDSIQTVLAQSNRLSPAMTSNGFNLMIDHQAIVAQEGHFALGHQKIAKNMAMLAGRATSVLIVDGALSEPLKMLARIMESAAKDDVQTVFFIYPLHAQFLQSIALSGRWIEYEEWKRQVLSLWLSSKTTAPGWQTALWDFGVLTNATEEAFPQPGDTRTQMQWWWEPGHFKAALGEQLLVQMLNQGEGFGVRLSSTGIETLLEHQRIRLADYTARHPAIIANLLALCPPNACTPVTGVADGVITHPLAARARS
jgi:hypothetical protein